MKPRLRPEQFQMFNLYALRRMPVAEVARLPGTNVIKVYMTRHRVARLLKREITELERLGM